MKPYGLRDKKTKGSGDWKKDYHIHQKNRKVPSWWEIWVYKLLSRSSQKQKTRKEIENAVEQ